MTLNIKIEILKVFSLDLNFSSDKDFKIKRDKPDEKESTTPALGKQSATSK
jgi:hypothetical protein